MSSTSGRSLTAHHSVLVLEVLETTQLPIWKDNKEISEDDHELIRELYNIWDRLDQQNILESWHDALQIREEALDLFSLGLVDLRTRAQMEELFWSICARWATSLTACATLPKSCARCQR